MNKSRLAIPAALAIAAALLIASARPGSAGEIAATQASAVAPQTQDANQPGEAMRQPPAAPQTGAVGFGWG